MNLCASEAVLSELSSSEVEKDYEASSRMSGHCVDGGIGS